MNNLELVAVISVCVFGILVIIPFGLMAFQQWLEFKDARWEAKLHREYMRKLFEADEEQNNRT